VPLTDSRLKNKAEILALRLDEFPDEPLAIAAEFLSANPVYHDRIGNREFVVLTDATGANRVYEAGSWKFKSWDQDAAALDEGGGKWTVTEAELTGPAGQALRRIPAHRAFWFGWYAAYPKTRLAP
jgi:hypothetical protein